MNGFQPFANGSGASNAHQNRHSMESAPGLSDGSRAQTDMNGTMAMPMGAQQRAIPSEMGPPGYGATMGMPRSPPKNKSESTTIRGGNAKRGEHSWLRYNADTAHVPCRFFLAGQCQAGRMCPFSHNIESTIRPAVCKYFAKGGCKFGRKCALLHVLPDGTVVNRVQPPPFSAGPPFPGVAQQLPPQPPTYAPPPPGLLSMQARGLEQPMNGNAEYDHYQCGPRNGFEQPIDMTLTSASPTHGSPPQNGDYGVSPPQKGLSVLDAPLPNSFDSNGISMAARNGPFAASVPSRFGIESPPPSLPRKSQLGNTALRDLHSSAFGDRGIDGALASMGSSPPSGTDEPLTFPKRPLHSEQWRSSRTMVSASLGTKLPTASFEYSDDEEEDADREEDLLPASLRDLIPEGRSRRASRNRPEDETPAGFLSAARRTLSGHGTSQESKLGSLGSSPSRYNSMFAARGQAAKPEAEGIGHVGSPLRNAGFSFASAPRSTNGELSPGIASPPRQASMSMLTQELQRTKLDAARSQGQAVAGAPISHPGPVRTLSNGSRSGLDRGMSSTSVSKIDEEQELFDMEEVGAPARASAGAVAVPKQNGAYGAIGGHRAAK